MAEPSELIDTLRTFDNALITPAKLALTSLFIDNAFFSEADGAKASVGTGLLIRWIRAVVNYAKTALRGSISSDCAQSGAALAIDDIVPQSIRRSERERQAAVRTQHALAVIRESDVSTLLKQTAPLLRDSKGEPIVLAVLVVLLTADTHVMADVGWNSCIAALKHLGKPKDILIELWHVSSDQYKEQCTEHLIAALAPYVGHPVLQAKNIPKLKPPFGCFAAWASARLHELLLEHSLKVKKADSEESGQALKHQASKSLADQQSLLH